MYGPRPDLEPRDRVDRPVRSPLEDPLFTASYEVLGRLGRGGMGEVVRVRHRVWEVELAAKIPLPASVASAGGQERFRKEAETWIRLAAHPNVVTCHYVRVLSGVPVLFSEYVPGGSLADWIRRGGLAPGSDAAVVHALKVGRDLAFGLAHSHAAGVVHQDVKPSNTLLDEHGAKLTDFGIANTRQGAGSADAASQGTLTVVGMTPLYASPEQMRAMDGLGSITRATDLWSLGLTLLETLLAEAAWKAGDPTSILALLQDVPADVRTVLAPLFAAPEQRPAAAELAVQLAELLAVRGVATSPPSPGMWLATGQNNRAVSAMDLGDRSAARVLLKDALAVDPCHPEALYNDALLAWRGGECSDVGALDRIRQGLSANRQWEAALLEAWVHVERGDEKAAWTVLDEVAERAAGAPRGTRAVARASRAVRECIREIGAFRAHPCTADALAFAGSRVMTTGRDGRVRVFELSTGARVREYAGHMGMVMGVAGDPDHACSVGWDGTFRIRRPDGEAVVGLPGKGSQVLVRGARAWTSTTNGSLQEWALSAEGATLVRTLLALPHDSAIRCVAFAPNGELFATSEDNHLRVFDTDTGELRREVRLDSGAHTLAFAEEAGDSVFLIGTSDNRVCIHDAHTLERRAELTGMASWVSTVAVSPDSRWMVCGTGLRWCLWDLPRRRWLRTFDAPAMLTQAQFVSNTELVTLDWEGYVRRYQIEAPSEAPLLVALPHRTREVTEREGSFERALQEASDALASDRLDVAIAAARRARSVPGFERAPRIFALWEALLERRGRGPVRAVWPLEQWGPVHAASGLVVDPQRRFVVTGDDDGSVTVWSLEPGHARLRTCTFASSELVSRSLALSEDGGALAIGTYKHLHTVDLATGELRTRELAASYVKAVAFAGASAGSSLAAADRDGRTHIVSPDDLATVAVVQGPEEWVTSVVFRGDRLLTGDYDGHVYVWDLATPEAPEADLGVHGAGGRRSVHALVVFDGAVYVAGSDGLHVIREGQRRSLLTGTDQWPFALAVAPDGYLLAGCADRRVRLLAKTGELLAEVDGHTHTIWGVAWLGPHAFLTVSDDGLLRRFYVDWEISQAG